MRATIASLGLLAALGTTQAGEEKIDLKKLPPGVLAAVRAKFPEGKLTGAAKEEEDRKVIYEVTLTDHDAKVDVAVSPKGKILEVEKVVAVGKLPQAVAATIKTQYPRAKITKSEEVIKYEEDEEEERFYEVILSIEGKDSIEVKLSPKGKVLDDEGDDDENDKKSKVKKDGK
jgi:hypothetical protein